MADSGVTIAMVARLGVEPRRVAKIIPYRHGGFAVSVPYHSAKVGFLGKMPVDYRKVGMLAVPRARMTRYSADDAVKLSYHPDGFVQFSSVHPGKIVSGRDPVTGEPKGLGLLTSPLSQPIKTGPTFGVSVWGIEDFETLPPNKPAELFGVGDWYYRSCTDDTANAWMIEAFVLPNSFRGGVHNRSGKPTITLVFGNFEAPGVVFELRVVDLPGQSVFIGLLVSRARVSFAAKSGFTLGGPGRRFPDGTGEVLMACYPADACGGTADAASLHYYGPHARKQAQ